MFRFLRKKINPILVSRNYVSVNIDNVRKHLDSGGTVAQVVSQLKHHMPQEDAISLLKGAGIKDERQKSIQEKIK